MLVKLKCENGDHWYVNTAHVVSLIPTNDGHAMVVTDYESEIIRDRVIVLGTIDEVAAKLNGESSPEQRLSAERRAGAAEAWFGAATHPGLPADIAEAFHMAAKRMRS